MNNQQAFLALVRAGLWEQDVELRKYGTTAFVKIIRLAEEQSVVGLVTTGLEHVSDIAVPQETLLQFIGITLQVEQRNNELNVFISKLAKKLNSLDVNFLLVKGQGVAQCYEKPLWRASGDVDLLLNLENYEKANKDLFRIAYDIEKEDLHTKHQALKIMGVEVELHGKMPFLLSRQAQMVNDEVVMDALDNKGASVWRVNDTEILIPNEDNHVYLIFTHLLHHFFIEGVGLRQICDWCRLLWTYRDSLNQNLLESRMRRAGLMSEWKVFGTLAVNYLGMPKESMPFYEDSYNKKAKRVLKRVMKTGNMGHNNDLSYRLRYKGPTYQIVAVWRRLLDFASLAPVFPVDAPKFFAQYVFGKVK